MTARIAFAASKGPVLKNCWEIKGCGREEGGRHAADLGVCPAARPSPCSGLNGGVHSGRICWCVAGTFCDGEEQAVAANKAHRCMQCEVFSRVRDEAGPSFQLVGPSLAHRALVEQFAAITSVVDSLNAVVYVADLETRELLFVSQHTEKIFGTGLLGRKCYEVLQPSSRAPCATCTNDRLVVNGRPGPPVIREVQNALTRRWFLCIDRAIPWVDGRLVRMEIAIDITDRKAAEQFREQYVGLVSHDLRSPLNGIILQAQVLRSKLEAKGLTAEVEAANWLLSGARRMNVLIEDLLETTHLESGTFELHARPVDLRDWVAAAIARVSPQERTRIDVRVEPEPLLVNADTNRLDRVLENLISNALKYSGAQAVHVALVRREREVLLTVRDHGVGIATEELPKLFERFYRAKNASVAPGLGLGLYNARLIVVAHGGRIWAESQLGRGTDFHVALPLGPG